MKIQIARQVRKQSVKVANAFVKKTTKKRMTFAHKVISYNASTITLIDSNINRIVYLAARKVSFLAK
jgi:hypothetical protein